MHEISFYGSVAADTSKCNPLAEEITKDKDGDDGDTKIILDLTKYFTDCTIIAIKSSYSDWTRVVSLEADDMTELNFCNS